MIQQASQAATFFEKRKQLVPNAQSVFHPSSGVSAHNATIVDPDGRELIDFAGGIGVVNSGHCPAPVVKAIQEQAAKMIHACFAVTAHQPYLDLCEELAQLLPHGVNGTKVSITNSGTEAVENAIKFARQATQRSAIICYEAAFHGRTYMALSLTSKTASKLGCGPFLSDIYRTEFPYYGVHAKKEYATEEAFANAHIEKLKRMFSYQVHPSTVAAVIVELVQGEGGFNPISGVYLQKMQEICKENGILLIVDEIQSGFGRTCKWAAYEHYGITPDISVWGKSIGGGMPVGAVMGSSEILDKALPGTIGGTYPGNPVCTAAALANIRYMKDIDILSMAVRVAEVVKARFETWQKKYPNYIHEVKGLGAMLSLAFVTKEGKPATEFTKNIVHRCWQKGLLIITAGAYNNHIRMLSPLTIPEDQLQKGLDILEETLEEVCV